ncbi:hypothetical protein J6590_090130 [Homalodisca vitripennis]|nr:hypothetical protein J6590_090130 [Homalodisca vitripennis]
MSELSVNCNSPSKTRPMATVPEHFLDSGAMLTASCQTSWHRSKYTVDDVVCKA